MAWKKGESGNVAGKPKGTRHRATTMLMALMEKNAESITQTVIEAAKSGDLAAARMILDRLAPHAKERPVSVDLPDTNTVEGINAAQQAILQAVAAGDLLPGEGTALAGIVEARRRALESLELERRIVALETRNDPA